MTTFTWVAGSSGDWNSTTNWVSGILPDSTATIILPDAGSHFVSLVGAGDDEIINALTIGGFSGVAPTLEIAGTLQLGGSGALLTFVQGTILVDSTGVFDGAATAVFYSSPFTVDFINNGLVRADAGSNTDLEILATFTNNGTLLADNGILLIGGASDANFVGSTLTGGTYIAEGPAAGAFNEIEFSGNYNAVITSLSADVILDGAATDIMGSSSGSFQTIEQQLETITSSGTLQLLDGRGYVTTNAITDNGVLNLQGGSLTTGGLSIGSSGTLEGFGIVGATVVDQGNIVASSGALDLAGGVSGTGALTVGAGSSLILSGNSSPSFVSNAGDIYDTNGLLTIDALSGNGTLVVQNGATLDVGVATSQEVVFSGSNATLELTSPSSYTGMLSGFGLGDSLVITGTADTATVVNGDTLAVISAGSTIDTFLLAGTYTGATFSVTQSGSLATIQNTAGAPARSDFQFNISLDDTAGLSGAEETEIVNDLSAAVDDWSQYVTGHAPLRIQLNIMNTSTAGSELANAGFTASLPNGEVIGGQTIYVPSSIYALTTGNYIAGTTADIIVNLPLQAGELGTGGDLYVNPDPFVSGGTVPTGEFDLLTVFRHEMAHGLGFDGFTDPLNGALGADVTLFDHYIQDTIIGGNTITAANFVGPNAEAAYGAFLGTNVPTPVPLTLLNNGENFFHVANSSIDPLGKDLMSGVGLNSGVSRDISSVDLAILEDVGLPVTAGLVCYVRGTRIATPDGETAIEALRIGDLVVTASGEHVPVRWIGRRRVDCRRHPSPEHVYPVRICANAFAPGMPRRDLLVSPQHGIYADEVLIPARCLINGRNVSQIETPRVEYLHIELDRHDLLLADGLAAESYLDVGDRGRFENGDGPMELHPDFSSLAWEGSGCAELKVAGPEVQSVRGRLSRRADALEAAADRAA